MLARLDDALFQARVDQARGRVAKAEADVEQARRQAAAGRARAGAMPQKLDRANATRSPSRNTTRP